MDRFVGKVAVVTGAGSGIGAAISKTLVKRGVIVAGLGRRFEKLQELATEMGNSKECKGKFLPYKCDITDEEEIRSSFRKICDEAGSISILVNSAGVVELSLIKDITNDGIDKLFNTNVKGLLLCTKEAIKIMIRHGTAGHIVNICSVLGTTVGAGNPNPYVPYSSTKHAVRAITEGLRREMINIDSKIKVTNLCPGYTNTEITTPQSDTPRTAYDALQANDVANACICILDTPPAVLISELIVRPLQLRD